MQLYARDRDHALICAHQASKQTDYFCLECQLVVRLRGGVHKQLHFYHKDANFRCRQSQKGLAHLHAQLYFLQQLPKGDCEMEYAFPQISRIADVVWFSQKIVFEIQCSPISAEEVLQRTSDYQSVGFEVVWILHDARYNQKRLTLAEKVLEGRPYFFTNFNEQGEGFFYDQFSLIKGFWRYCSFSPLEVKLTEPAVNRLEVAQTSFPLRAQRSRVKNWPFSFPGDLLNRFIEQPHLAYWQEAIRLEKRFYARSYFFLCRSYTVAFWERLIARPCRIFFRYFLERACR